MSYYASLNLHKEPFSTSPDPEFFFHSSAHTTALQRLEIAIRLRRGLSLILGDVGTGKTTLSRTLLQTLTEEEGFCFHMILDPTYKSEFQFLSQLVKMFSVRPLSRSTLDYKEAIEKYLFQKGVEENKTLVLLIDEGQKLSTPFLEILRTLLNYETNEYKLLQLVILAQMELLPRLRKIKNFMDRISLKYIINPLDEAETKQMIEFRLSQAGFSAIRQRSLADGGNSNGTLFTDGAIRQIFEVTQGYPRRISILCHNALEALVMENKPIVDEKIIKTLVQNEVR
ncbi:MAG: AAA family ATPase [Candidatus Omnitrophica bacterium]|nr:AAA family ATPase [Candidatus Omnitrophota bacterium]